VVVYDLLLSIDVGTQSIRTICFDLDGSIVALEKTQIQSYYSPKPGWAEQNPEYFWKKLSDSTNAFFYKNKELSDKIKGLSITTQRSTLVNIEKNGNILRPAIVWPDQRRAKKYRSLGYITELGFRLINMMETVRFAQSEAEINWLIENEPEIVEKTHKFLFLSGYLIYRLTGLFRDSSASQVGYIPFDYKRFEWCKASNWKWKAFPVPKDQLPKLVKPTEILGTVSHRAAVETSLPENLPIIASGADKACEILGAGCQKPNSVGLSFGTTTTASVNTAKYIEIIPFIPPYPSVIPGMYSPEIQIYRGFWLVSWFKREFGVKEVMDAKLNGMEPEMLFENLLDQVPPGSNGLILQPFWSPGVKIPGPEAKGAIIGFGEVHTRAHLYRAIIEGLCYALKDGVNKIERRGRNKIVELRVSGGGSQSRKALQITADIFNLPVIKPSIFETASLGAAIDTSVGLKYFLDVQTASKAMTHDSETILPDKKNISVYDDLYRAVYKKMYARLKPFYHSIRRITNYPEY